jgi:hypothetical protein
MVIVRMSDRTSCHKAQESSPHRSGLSETTIKYKSSHELGPSSSVPCDKMIIMLLFAKATTNEILAIVNTSLMIAKKSIKQTN